MPALLPNLFIFICTYPDNHSISYICVMLIKANVADSLIEIDASVADKYVGITLICISLGLFFAGLAMLPTKSGE